jgi:hypothetical protein
MDRAAWWESYFGGVLDDEPRWPIGEGTAIGVRCNGAERRVIVEHAGERTVFGDGEAVMPWDALVTIAVTRPQCLAALQRFTWIAMTDVPAANRALREAHAAIGVMGEIGPFVDRTLVYAHASGAMPPAVEHVLRAVTHATPDAAYDHEYSRGVERLREARRMPEGASGRAAWLRAAADRFFTASELEVDAKRRAEALCYSGATLVEQAAELALDDALRTLELAASRLDLVTRIDPQNLDGRRRAADAYHHMGDRICNDEPARAARLYAQTTQHARELVEATPGEDHAVTLDILIGAEVMIEDCLRRAGQIVDAKEALVRALEATYQLARSTMNSACAYAAAGHVDEAFRVLEKAAPGSATADDLRSNTSFDVLHADPRWGALIAKL